MRDFGLSTDVLLCEKDSIFTEEIKRNYSFFKIECLTELAKKTLVENQLLNCKKRYDYVYIGRMLEQSLNPIALLAACRELLTGDGWLLAIVSATHYRKQQEIRMLNIDEDEEAIAEITVFFRAAKYEDLRFNQTGECLEKNFYMKNPDTIKACDFDIKPSYWLLKAGKYNLNEKTSWLRSFFLPEVRQELAYILRRIENDIDRSYNCQQLWQLCEQYEITAEYLIPFIQNTMLKPKQVLKFLSEDVERGKS